MNPKYWAEVLESLKNAPGTWDSLKVGVFTQKDGIKHQVTEYKRNYSSLSNTFCWFTKDGKDYALYSPDYTATRLMSLPDGKDIGGELPDGHGFCPTDFHVPSFTEYQFSDDAKFEAIRNHKYRVYDPESEKDCSADVKLIRGLTHEPFGFVAGCIWGDDTSWKIEYLDLSEVDRGKLTRDQRFGYIQLPANLKLKDAISADCYDETGRVEIATSSQYDVKTGKKNEW